jgi:16S rRNA G966 N2-methylase RsmD
MAVELRPVAGLRANPGNARTHSDRQISQLAASIRTFGFLNPILVDEQGMVLAGHGRLAAARLLGLDEVPVVQVTHLTPAHKRALVLADNRLAELAGWDRNLLKIELAELSTLDLDFEVEITGFDTVEIDRLLQVGIEEAQPDPADDIPPVDIGRDPVTRLGDVWCLGRHRLMCGSALERTSYAQLLQNERAQMVFTDPPYNVPIKGHVSGKGRHQHSEFVMGCGEMSAVEFTAFLADAVQLMAQHSRDGAIHFICMDWRHQGELLRAGLPTYGTPKNLCVWVKDNAGMGSFYRSRHELVFVFKVGAAPHINNFGLGERGRYRTNVWEYPGVNTFGATRDADLAMHPTVKPVALVSDAIRDCSQRAGIILDPFGGSGTTLIAAERTGRHARLLELDSRYADVIVRRWQAFTSEPACLAETDQSFAEVSKARDAHDGANPCRDTAGHARSLPRRAIRRPASRHNSGS